MNKNNGLLALISVIVITMILLGVTATLGMKGFLDRFNILEGEAKETSAGLAAACVDTARVSISNEGENYAPSNQVLCLEWPCPGEDDDKKCLVESVLPTTGVRTILTHAVYKRATTNYEVEVDSSVPTIPITSWKEI